MIFSFTPDMTQKYKTHHLTVLSEYGYNMNKNSTLEPSLCLWFRELKADFCTSEGTIFLIRRLWDEQLSVVSIWNNWKLDMFKFGLDEYLHRMVRMKSLAWKLIVYCGYTYIPSNSMQTYRGLFGTYEIGQHDPFIFIARVWRRSNFQIEQFWKLCTSDFYYIKSN